MKTYSMTKKAIYCRNKRKSMSKEERKLYDHTNYLKNIDYYRKYAIEYNKTHYEQHKMYNRRYYYKCKLNRQVNKYLGGI